MENPPFVDDFVPWKAPVFDGDVPAISHIGL